VSDEKNKDVSALGCREVGFYCDTWGKHYSQLVLPKNLDQSRPPHGAPFRRTAEGLTKSLNLENSLECEVRLPSSKETLQLRR
jgi:hypothetical protein